MKKIRFGIPILAAILLFGFMSCQNFEMNTFKSLYGTASIRDMGMSTVSQLQKSGIVTAEQRVIANKAATVLKASLVTATYYFKAWKNSPNKAAGEELKRNLESSMTAISQSFTEWQKVINTFVPGTIQGTYQLNPTIAPKAIKTELEDKGLKARKGTFLKKKAVDPAMVSVIIEVIGIAIQYGVPQLSALLENWGKSEVTIADIDGILALLKDAETY